MTVKISPAALILAIAGAPACAPTHVTSAVQSSSSSTSVFVFESPAEGFNTKTVFYDDGTEVVAFDTQFTPAFAEQAIAFLRTKTANPLTYAVVTHPNPDKFNGIPTFHAAGAKVIMAATTAAAMADVDAYKRAYFIGAGMFTVATYPALGKADVTFQGTYRLSLRGGGEVQLQELAAAGVSTVQTVAFLPSPNALIVGDLVHHQAHAWLEGGIVQGKPTPTLGGWDADLNELTQRYGSSNPTVYGGRGKDVSLDVAIPAQRAYLRQAKTIVATYVDGLTAQQRASLAGPNASAQYAEIQQLFVAAFPNYDLAYMIGYGVYGLVNQVLAAPQTN